MLHCNATALGTPHPYVWKVSGTDAKSFSLIGTIHMSVAMIYGSNVPTHMTSPLESADSIFTEVDVNSCNLIEDDMGSPDCSAHLEGVAPAALHFKEDERHRIAEILANNHWWRDDLKTHLNQSRTFCEDDIESELLEREELTEAEIKDLWTQWPAPAIPWLPVREWRMLEYIWLVGSGGLQSIRNSLLPYCACIPMTYARPDSLQVRHHAQPDFGSGVAFPFFAGVGQ